MADLELYYHPGSYFTQRVLMAFEEKKLPYKPHLIDLWVLENHSAWYLKEINQAGQVPALRDGTTVIPDSDQIIKHIDSKFKPSILIPDYDRRDLLLTLADSLNEIEIDTITYGVCVFPELAKNSKMPARFSKMAKEKVEKRTFVKVLKEQYKKHPELAHIFEEKIKKNEKMNDNMQSKERVKAKIDEVQDKLKDMEKQLISNGFLDSAQEKWLVGNSFTLPDIYLSILLARLTMSGLTYLSENDKMPAISKYHEQVRKRESYKLWAVEAPSLRLMTMLMKSRMINWAKYASIFGLGILTAYCAYRYLKQTK